VAFELHAKLKIADNIKPHLPISTITIATPPISTITIATPPNYHNHYGHTSQSSLGSQEYVMHSLITAPYPSYLSKCYIQAKNLMALYEVFTHHATYCLFPSEGQGL